METHPFLRGENVSFREGIFPYITGCLSKDLNQLHGNVMSCMVCSTSRGTIVIYQRLDMTCEVEKMPKDENNQIQQHIKYTPVYIHQIKCLPDHITIQKVENNNIIHLTLCLCISLHPKVMSIYILTYIYISYIYIIILMFQIIFNF